MTDCAEPDIIQQVGLTKQSDWSTSLDCALISRTAHLI